MKIEFILVEPEVPENIGSAARALNTMGFSTLKLINPVEHLDGKAKWVAHGSFNILEEALVFSTLSEAVQGSDLVIATTAKERWVKKEYISSENLRPYLLERVNSINKVSIIFGRERSGLTNEEIEICDVITSVSLACKFPSLNLAQAVMVYAYELSSMRDLGKKETGEVTRERNEASLRNLKKKVSGILSECGIPNDDLRHGRIMDRLSYLTDNDINLMHSASAAIIDKIKGEA